MSVLLFLLIGALCTSVEELLERWIAPLRSPMRGRRPRRFWFD